MDEKNAGKLFTEADKKKLLKNLKIFLVLAIIAIVIFIFPDIKAKEETDMAEFSAINRICELATLRCYYHNVAEDEKEPDGLFKYGIFQYGYKKFWIEYDGIVEIGIDVSKVNVYEPDEDNIVRVYVPKAEILNLYPDDKSMREPVFEKGVFTTITSEEKVNAFSKAQMTMKENAATDKSILNQAHENAKKLLEQYIINVGKQIGQDYSVEWIADLKFDEEQEGE